MTPRLDMQGIVKRYPGVLALDNVSFTLKAGEVHCLLGENGAGKSTLMKILSGAQTRDAGTVRLDGTLVDIRSPREAREHGIGMIYQDFRQVPDLSVAENMYLGREPTAGFLGFVDRPTLLQNAREALNRLGEDIDPSLPIGTLSVAQRQIVEIAKALSHRSRVIAFDEPTSSLTDREIASLFAIIRRLRDEGTGVIYISHRLEEVFALGDRVTVLRDGRNVATAAVSGIDRRRLIQWMVGREVENEYPRIPRRAGKELLRVENLCGPGLGPVSFSLVEGEILGLAGLVGSGRSTLARTIFGAGPRTGGKILLNGAECAIWSPGDAIAAGIALLPEDRNISGLVMQMSVGNNITLAALRDLSTGPFLDTNREELVARRHAAELRIRPEATDIPVETLSGGNRQKVVLARWLSTNARVLIFDEPTVGIDVGVKYEIYTIINRLAAQGIGTLIISSDLPELLGICHRIAVLCEGRLTGIVDCENASQEQIMSLATARTLDGARFAGA